MARVERRLAAILAADVAGYSRLMSADEEGTHERHKAHLRNLIDPKIKEHHGRIVKNTGDGLLAEFPSAENAVRCAAEITAVPECERRPGAGIFRRRHGGEPAGLPHPASPAAKLHSRAPAAREWDRAEARLRAFRLQSPASSKRP